MQHGYAVTGNFNVDHSFDSTIQECEGVVIQDKEGQPKVIHHIDQQKHGAWTAESGGGAS
eukprot:1556553-Rhodomonas_salina.1